MALVALSVVERRLDAVRAVLTGASVTEVAAGLGTSRQTIHTWLARYLSEGLAGLADRSHRPRSSPLQVEAAVEARVAELRRAHPRWGATRIRMEMVKAAAGASSVARHRGAVRTGVAVRARRLAASNVSGVPRPRERVGS